MKEVLILGAGGQIARWAIQMLGERDDVSLTLFLRQARRLKSKAPSNARVLEGDVRGRAQLDAAMTGQDIVHANLTGDDIDAQAKSVIGSMKKASAQRLVFVTSLGIYDEVPGKFGAWNTRNIGAYLPPFRRAADAIEASGLDYTILRPAWLSDEDEVDYEMTGRSEPFKGTAVSRKSVADLVVKIIDAPERWVRENLGINELNTDGDKPAFM